MLALYNGQPGSYSVYLYHRTASGGDFSAPYRQGITDTSPDQNFHCDVEGIDDSHPTIPPITTGSYYLRVGNRYTTLYIGEALNPNGDTDFRVIFDGYNFALDWDHRGTTILGSTTTTWTSPEVDVTVDQKLSNNTTTVGFVKRWSPTELEFEDILPLGRTFKWQQNFGQIVRGDQNIYYGEKYNNWSASSDITNHQTFQFSVSTPLISKFKPIVGGVIITSSLIDVTGVQGDSVDFKDPWRIDLMDGQHGNALMNRGQSGAPFLRRAVPFYPNLSTHYDGYDYQGIFLNQSGPPEWLPPYYSVAAPSPRTINGFTAFFVNWATSAGATKIRDANVAQTDVKFELDGTTISGLYKAHLGSGITAGFATSGQRRLVRDGLGYLHMTYASGGSVWYCRSTNGGLTWSNELRVNPIGSQAKCPAISATNDGGTNVCIAYQIDADGQFFGYGPPPGNPAIILARYDGDQQLWAAVVDEIPAFNFDALPAIYVWNLTGCVVYKGSASTGLVGAQITFVNGNISNQTDFVVPNTNGGSSSPSVAMYPTSGQPWNLFYQQGDTAIYAVQWYYPPLPASPVNISTGSSSRLCKSPSGSVYLNFATGGYVPIVSWTGQGMYTSMTVIRKQIGGVWGSFYLAGQYLNGGTEVGCTRDGSFMQAIVGWWNTYSNKAQFIRQTNGSFGSIYNLPTSGDFHITDGGGFADMKAALFYSTGSLPYPIRPLTYNFLTLSKAGISDSLRFGRSATLTSYGCEMSYALQAIRLDEGNVVFEPTDGVCAAKSDAEFNKYLRTTTFALRPGSNLTFTTVASLLHPERASAVLAAANSVTFRTELVEASTDAVVGTFSKKSLSAASIIDTGMVRYSLDCSQLKTGEYFLRIVVDAQNSFGYSVSDIQYEETAHLQKPIQEMVKANESQPRPASFSLETYPNPFNPSTTISFAMPISGLVRIIVFDVLGREVAVLANGRYEPGYHRIVWNGRNSSSGMYLARMDISDQSGRTVFHKTSKLLLSK